MKSLDASEPQDPLGLELSRLMTRRGGGGNDGHSRLPVRLTAARGGQRAILEHRYFDAMTHPAG